MVDLASVALRALSFLLLLQAAGTPLFAAIFGRTVPGSVGRIRRIGQVIALAAILAVAARYVLEAARMAGDLSGVLDRSLQTMVWQSSSGSALLLQLSGLVLIAVGLHSAATRGLIAAIIGGGLAISAFALTGHTATNAHRPWLAPLLVTHVLIVAFWLGALWSLFLVTLWETPAAAAHVIDRFSKVAVWVVPGILAAGLALACGLLANLAALGQPYGELLLAKLGLFSVLMVLAALNKLRLGPAISRDAPYAARAFRLSLAAEYLLIAMVLAVTAVMTTFFSPE